MINPGSVEEVQRIVKVFNQHETGVSLHTISTSLWRISNRY
ncbi:hypothetical protein XBO1_2600004 [Xenorhabdus bovienii str. oregonense]|uniref:Uncharacterized protein n=1 Tax=Xenorhabdus bovienii str. oregonense TaxID=1398202 RepID=A0A077P8T8_XENBV|nr:hypothetical protein XBO1_2600004 [Xenorhabdus bovienii str. oregonense]